jgi:hypothetical protein
VDRMNALKTGNRNETPVRETRPGLDVLLMYEDFSAGLRARWLLDEVVGETRDRPSPAEQTIRVRFVSARSQIVPVRVKGAFNNRDASQMSLKQVADGAWINVTPRLAGRNEFVNLQSSTVNTST